MVLRKPFLTTCDIQRHDGGAGSHTSLSLFGLSSDLYLVGDSETWVLSSQGSLPRKKVMLRTEAQPMSGIFHMPPLLRDIGSEAPYSSYCCDGITQQEAT